MIDALEQGHAKGRASVMYDGKHIDMAHVRTARDIIELTKAYSQQASACTNGSHVYNDSTIQVRATQHAWPRLSACRC
jgi:hypothetical protein